MKLALFVLLLPIVAAALGGVPWIAAAAVPSRWPLAAYLAVASGDGWAVHVLGSLLMSAVIIGGAAHRLARGCDHGRV